MITSSPTRWGRHLGETCVTTTWIQLNLQLLRLTGEAKYGDELERSIYNHLAAAQNPRGDDWCYYTALEGKKQYDAGITCCHSSGPRGMALAVQAAYLAVKTAEAECLLVNTFEDSRVELELGGQRVSLTQDSHFPWAGEASLTFHMARPATFGLLVRVPKWVQVPLSTDNFKLTVNGQPDGFAGLEGYATVRPRQWKDGDGVKLSYRLGPRLIPGRFGNADRAALAWGPFVLAYDEARNPGLPRASAVGLARESTTLLLQPRTSLVFQGSVVGRMGDGPKEANFVPFADAGSTGGEYRVWLRAPGVNATTTLMADAHESRSRQGNQNGSIIDGDPGSFVVTYDGTAAKEDWYAVTIPRRRRSLASCSSTARASMTAAGLTRMAANPRCRFNGPREVRGRRSASWADIRPRRPPTAVISRTARRLNVVLAHPVSGVAVRVLGVPPAETTRTRSSRHALSSRRSRNEPRPSFCR